MMTKKTHFTENEVGKLVDLFAKTVVWFLNICIHLKPFIDAFFLFIIGNKLGIHDAKFVNLLKTNYTILRNQNVPE